ncbi:DUF499 domain-containing protein [soil metagenome]
MPERSPLSTLCVPRESVFDRSRRDTVLDLDDLVAGKIDGAKFFEENFVTDGMRRLLREGFRRLQGQSDQSVFVLSQAMGGGKTHNMISLGLLAKHPELRAGVMGDDYNPKSGAAPVRVVGFSGRESDAPLGVWGSIAEQLGKKDQFAPYYSPLAAPGTTAWIELLRGEPLLILLDELPPYFENARSKTIGNSDLAQVTTTALSNLLIALAKDELSNVCVVISDLKATYQGGSGQIHRALSNLENEVGRSAVALEPVGLNTNDVYHILRTRLFASLPEASAIKSVAEAYAAAVRDAKQMDITNASPEAYATQIQESFPFHFSLRDLYARFRENPGFQQTRGLITLMRVVVSRMWDSGQATSQSLIHPYDIDLNDPDTKALVAAINPKLDNAIAHDIASGGDSAAEALDASLPEGSKDAQDASKLLLVASLANTSGATLGLGLPEIVSFLCRPGRDVSHLPKDVLGVLTTRAWYLHSDRDGRLFYKDVQNLVAKLNTTAKSYTREISLKKLREFLGHVFAPSLKDCYQEVLVLPAVDEIDLAQDKVSLVVAEPAFGSTLSHDLQAFWADATFRNRVAFLGGERETLERLLETAAELRAITSILDEIDSQNLAASDPQRVGAEDMLGKIQLRMLSVARESFTKIYYPGNTGGEDALLAADFLMNFADNNYNGEQQIRQALAAKQKFTDDTGSDTFRKKCEQRLFTQQQMPYAEIKRRAAMNPKWQWHIPSALETLRANLVLADQWREDGGLIDKGPFPPPETSIQIQELKRDENSGQVSLRLTPTHADTVLYEIGGPATPSSARVPDLQNFVTSEFNLTFLAVDSTGEHATGAVRPWKNKLTLRHRFFQSGSEMHCEISAAPAAPITYTTDGSDPKHGGGSYVEPFPVPPGTVCVLAAAEKNGVSSEVARFDVPRNAAVVEVDPARPCRWTRSHSATTTQDTYGFLKRLKKFQATASAVRLDVGDEPRWLSLDTASGLPLAEPEISGLLGSLREIVREGQAQLKCSAIHFEKGQDLLDWIAETKENLDASQIQQSGAE